MLALFVYCLIVGGLHGCLLVVLILLACDMFVLIPLYLLVCDLHFR